jgi:hypothetical protein
MFLGVSQHGILAQVDTRVGEVADVIDSRLLKMEARYIRKASIEKEGVRILIWGE